MRKLTKRIATGFALATVFCGVARAKGRGKNPGQSLFESNCVLCHGDDGTAKTPSGAALGAHDLTSIEVSKKSDSELGETITQGRGNMPGFGQKLSDAEIHELVSYISELQKKKN